MNNLTDKRRQQIFLSVKQQIDEAKLRNSKSNKKEDITEARVVGIKDELRKQFSFWKAYPDLFLDTILPKSSSFNFYFYQRLFLRIAIRYKLVYATFTRAFSKSFLSIIIEYLKCIFYPGAKQFITTGGKGQAAQIAEEKIKEIWGIWPVLKDELVKWSFQKDGVKLEFKNGSILDVVGMRDSTRGGRRHGGLIEEAILIDGNRLNEVIIPLMNISRTGMDGVKDPRDVNNKSQIYVTTAGYKGSFAYEKLIQVLLWQIIKPKEAFVLGGDYRIPVMHGLLDKNFIKELKADGTYNEMSFSREYGSRWSGTKDGAFFDAEIISKYRVLGNSEIQPDGRSSKDTFYVFGIDVGRHRAQTIVVIIKVTLNRTTGAWDKKIVNLHVFEDMHFEDQAGEIKYLFNIFRPRAIAIDGTGLGTGLIDFLVKETDYNGVLYEPFGVLGEDYKEDYEAYIVHNTIPILYIVKATPAINSAMHSNIYSQLTGGRIKFLANERIAKTKFASKKGWSKLASDSRAEKLKPFTLTSILKEEMLNLKRDGEGADIRLKRVHSKIGKDKFSALEIGLYYIYLKEREKKTRRVGIESIIKTKKKKKKTWKRWG